MKYRIHLYKTSYIALLVISVIENSDLDIFVEEKSEY